MATTRKPRRTLPRIHWGAVNRSYLKRLNGVLDEMIRLVNLRVMTQLDSLAEQQRARLGLRVDSPFDEVEGIVASIEEEFSQIFPSQFIERMMREQGLEASNANRQQVKAQLKALLGIDVFAESPALVDILDGFTKDNVRLIKSMTRDYLNRIEGEVKRGFREGRRASDIAKRIQSETKISKNRAKLIARDQIASINGEMTRNRQRTNGITRFRWRTSMDERVRGEHEDLEGNVYSWETGDPTEGFPGQPINCRCYAEPVFEGEEA